MIRGFLKIRLIQLRREVQALGFVYFLFFLGLFSFTGLILYKQLDLYPNALYLSGLIASIVLAIHVKRKDKKFIATTAVNPKWIFLSEYSFFSIPVFVVWSFSRHWYLIILLLVSYVAIIFVNFEPKKRAGVLPFSRFIPTSNFEWIAGFRKNIWYLLPLYALAIGLLFIKFISLFVLWLILGVIASFYQECEPSNIIQIPELPARSFIIQKLKSHLKVYLIFTVPIIIGYLALNIDTAWVALLIYFLSTVNFCYFILSKYSVYEPNMRITGNSIMLGLVMISVFIPFFLPLPIVMCFREYRKSKANLEYYLHAYN